MDTKECFALYKAACLRCSHLVEGAKKKYTKCHFSQGNKQCPASEVRIVVVGRAARYAQKVLKARDTRNVALEAEILAKLAKEPEGLKAKFFDYIDDPGSIEL